MPPWLITIMLGLAGLVVQALLLAYFIGRMKEHQSGQERLVDVFQKFTTDTINAMMERLAALDGVAAESRADRATLNARLHMIEHNTEGLQALRESFAGHVATFDAHRERQVTHMEKVDRELAGIHRQLANIASKRMGEVYELPASGGVDHQG